MAKRPQPRKWNPINKEKYQGDYTNIIARSSWEIRFFNWCDLNPSILYWSSEEVIVPYICATDGKWHRYFLDGKITVKNKTGEIKTYLIEIKPEKETMPPIYPGKQTKRYLTETLTFMKNQSKWKAAKQFAYDRKWEFIVLTEKHLFDK